MQTTNFENRVETLALNTTNITPNANSPEKVSNHMRVSTKIMGSTMNSFIGIGRSFAPNQSINPMSVSQTDFSMNDIPKGRNVSSFILKPPKTAAEVAKTDAIRTYLL